MNPYTATLQAVWKRPTCVSMEQAAVDRLAERLSIEEFEIPAWRESVFPTDEYMFVDFIFVGNAINFAFTDFETGRSFSVTHNGTTWRGAFAMWACLRRALDAGTNILSSDFLREVSLEQAREIFAGDTQIPLIHERCTILQETGAILCERFGGQFRNLLKACDERAFGEQGVVTQLVDSFPSFRDESFHQPSGSLLKFEKRAQLLAMMYQGRALSSMQLPVLCDADDLGPIADYSIPRALHAAGVLQYSQGLQTRITNKVTVPQGSIEEQELRAQATLAQIVLRDSLRRLGKPKVNFLSLDYKLWTLGRAAAEPHHLTRTTAY